MDHLVVVDDAEDIADAGHLVLDVDEGIGLGEDLVLDAHRADRPLECRLRRIRSPRGPTVDMPFMATRIANRGGNDIELLGGTGHEPE